MDLYSQPYQEEPEVLDTSIVSEKTKNKVKFNTLRVYLFFGLALMLTAVVGCVYPVIILSLPISQANDFSLWSLICGSIGAFISFLIIAFNTRSRKGIMSIIGLVVLSISLGLIIGPALFISGFNGTYMDYSSIYLAFGMTALIFIILGCISNVVQNIRRIFVILSSLSSVLILLLLVDLIFFFTGAAYGNNMTNMWISFAIQAIFSIYIILYTILDFKRIEMIGKQGGFDNQNGLAVYCAAQLYYDFIYIFIRVLILIAAFSQNSNDN